MRRCALRRVPCRRDPARHFSGWGWPKILKVRKKKNLFPLTRSLRPHTRP
jgi:hypothetical protein